MKIAIFTDIYAPWSTGGIASSVKAQKDELEKLGHEVVVFCPGFNAREKNVITVPSHEKIQVNGAVLAKRPQIIEAYIRDQFPELKDFDIVHVHYEASCSIAGVQLAKAYDLPLVQTMHGREDMAIAINVPYPFKHATARILSTAHGRYLAHDLKVQRDKFQAPNRTRALMWELMINQAEQADVVVTPSKHFAWKLEHYGVTRPIVPVSNGISESLLSQDFQTRRMTDGDVLKMVWSSRVSNEKRIMPFLRAVAQLKRPYMLYIYGDGNALKKAQKFAREHRLKVKFYGCQLRQKILQKMQEAHLGVLASYNFDTQGMVLLESEATGLPVFFCDPTLIEAVPEGGYVLAGGIDATSMALALDSLQPEQIEKMSAVMLKNRQDVLQSKQIKQLLKVYALAKQIHKSRKLN